MNREFQEWEIFKLHPTANLEEESLPAHYDQFDLFFSQLELEMAGGPVLPAKETRLRSERDQDSEPFEKFASAAGRKKQAISEYLKRRRAAGASVQTIIRELTERCERLDPELIAMLKGENE
jgi:hypothetical protein